MSEFVHLHVHSHYSLLDGLSKIPDLVANVKAKGMNAVALTDHGVLYGAIEFYQEAIANGIKPIIGMEAYVAPGSRHDKRAKLDERYYHLVLLAENFQGYKNLLQLSSLAHLEGYYYKPRIDWELLEQYHEGLIALSGCIRAQPARQIITGAPERQVIETIQRYQKLFGQESYYLEIQHRPSLPEQQQVNAAYERLGRELGVGLVATNDSHYLEDDDREAQDVLLCLQTKSKKEDTNRLSMVSENCSLTTPQEMVKLFSHVPEAITNTVKIAARCTLEIPLHKIMLPRYDVAENETPMTRLRALCQEGLKNLSSVGDPVQYQNRLEYELSVIEGTGFASYFLIVADFVNWARSQGIMVGPGRGSAAGSLASYLLHITSVDPIQYNLFFERFLNPERISMPDIDLDFADRRRDEVLRYVQEKYGHDHVAQIITFGTMAGRAAIRDCGRVLGLSYSLCDGIAKLIPMFTNLDDALENVTELKELYINNSDVKLVVDMARKVENVARHSSTHACGVVITDKPLVEYVPLQYASSDDRTIICQYNLHSVEDLGLLKMDFLGLSNLTILEDAIRIIRERQGIVIDLAAIPLSDSKTFELLKRGDTTGVFQLESSGMKRYLRELQPTILEDIIAMVALYRPGPMEFIPDFIAGKHGKKAITYLHPKLEPILKNTYGIAVYQEQVLQIARDIAGFSLSQADVLRKAIGKKIKTLLMEQREKFVKGATKQGVSPSVAEKLFDFTEPFARYGFNRAHAACYGLIAYQTAFLKANYPVEFMTALLIAEQGDVERIAVVVKECQAMSISVLAPDVNTSGVSFTADADVAQPVIRFGLSAIKNIGDGVAEAIADERAARGEYDRIESFLRRLSGRMNRRSIESLIKAGALDHFGDRSQFLGNLDKMMRFAKGELAQATAQPSLFTLMSVEPSLQVLHFDPVTNERQETLLAWEKDLLGLYVSAHPTARLRAQLDRLSFPYEQVLKGAKGENVVIGGLLTTIKRINTKNGELMAFARMEDAQQSLEVIVFPRVYKESQILWQEGTMLLVRGKITERDGSRQVICDRVMELTLEKAQELVKAIARPEAESQA